MIFWLPALTLPPTWSSLKGDVDFLGHSNSAPGSHTLADKVAAIAKHPLPNTVRELQQFLGMLNFYRSFLPSAARLLALLTDSLKGAPATSTAIP